MEAMAYFVFVCSVTISTLFSLACAENGERHGSGHVFRDTRQDPATLPEWDPKGYVFFCLCMGRTGNQIDHFLGGLEFAKRLDRTLVLPPFRTYRNVRFTEWFKLEAVAKYHRVILAEDFLEYLAPDHWPPKKRKGMCWGPPGDNTKCEMKNGNPFTPFWDGLGVDFAETEKYYLTYSDSAEKWNKLYPPSRYPVLAFRGAPARFPVASEHRQLQQYLEVSDYVNGETQDYIDQYLSNKKFIGIHMRNGPDWAHACQAVDGVPSYMASPQCLEGTNQRVSKQMCFPDDQEIFRLLGQVIEDTGVKTIFIATDKRPMIQEIEEHFSSQKVRVFHADPHLPLVDLTILTKSEYFIGNCVSSFTAYVKRARDVEGKPTSFWGFS